MSNPPSFPVSSLLIMFGGGLGAWLRYLIGRLWLMMAGPSLASAFPWATLTANVTGSLAMGLLTGWLARHGPPAALWSGEHWRLLLGAGVLGGFTTFSSFALEFGLFIERGSPVMAAAYVAITLTAGFAALFAGLFTMRAIG